MNADTPPSEELLGHVASEHLPLRCTKCDKVYKTMEDFVDGERCCRIDGLNLVREQVDSIERIKGKFEYGDNDGGGEYNV